MGSGFNCLLLFLVVPMIDSSHPGLCRERHGVPLEPEVFRMWACAECYRYLFPSRLLTPLYPRYLVLYTNISMAYTISYEADVNQEHSRNGVCSTLTSDECERWVACCHASWECCQKQLEENSTSSLTQCPRTWDGWGCWADTPVSTTAYLNCPAYILYSIPSSYAMKMCNTNATWYRNEEMEWTDYTPCLDKDGLILMVYISLGCTFAGILVLSPACVIFLGFRSLRRQHRIRVHINFFLSFIMSGVSVALWDIMVTYDKLTNPSTTNTLMYQNNLWCKVLSFLKIYFTSTNYIWMFCEGFYLHRLISNAFKPPSSLLPLYIMGWGFPLLSSTVYSIIRVLYANKSCWAISFKHYGWIVYTPNLLCLVSNLIFLCFILRILTTQIHVHPNEPSSFRRALKATFVLLPLFGIQLFVTIYRLPPGTPGEAHYEQFTIFLKNSQGLFVALLFCFFNNEVLGLLRQKFSCWRSAPSMNFTSRRTMIESTGYGSPTNNSLRQSIRMTSLNSEKDYATSQKGRPLDDICDDKSNRLPSTNCCLERSDVCSSSSEDKQLLTNGIESGSLKYLE